MLTSIDTCLLFSNFNNCIFWLGQIRYWFETKTTAFEEEKVLFHQDNVRVHTCLVTMAKIHELGYEQAYKLPHPAYYPDLASSDYFLFSNLKKWLGGIRNGE